MSPVLLRVVGSLLIYLLSGTTEPLLFAQQLAPQSSEQDPAQQPAQNSTQPPIELPENPGVSPSQSAPPATAPATPANQAQQPSGTAAAPSVPVSGSAASKPAGVAIAPPKQHQIRSWLIRFGFIAGAGAALGTVAALSAASPGRVPNSPR
jgi:hypothetical protein